MSGEINKIVQELGELRLYMVQAEERSQQRTIKAHVGCFVNDERMSVVGPLPIQPRFNDLCFYCGKVVFELGSVHERT